ncbi:MAG: MATE family efflux transporter [Sphingomonas sp. SCN 67-18]|nr:MAG: MATE family efflux transporter [Sphingomonas sp. SCN 67-18]
MKIGRTEMIDESRRIMGLAWPVVLTSLNWTLLHLTDVIVVGLTGTGEVAALGASRTLTFVTIVMGIAWLSGVLVHVSRADGAKDLAATGDHFRSGMMLGLAIGLVSGVILFLFAESLLLAIGVSPLVAPEGARVVQVMALAYPFQFVMIAASYFLEGVSRPRRVMAVNLAILPVNAVLAWAWSGGHLGLPAMGAVGAGAATSVASLIGTVLMVLAAVRLPRAGPRGVKDFSRAAMARAARGVPMLAGFGLVPAIASALELGGFSWLIALSTQLGVVTAHAYQIVFSLHNVTFALALGLGSAAGVRVGNAVGAGETGQARPRTAIAAGMAVLVTALAALAMAVLALPIVALFPATREVHLMAALMLPLWAPFILFDGLQVVLLYALRSLGDQVAAGLNGIVAFFIVTGGLGWLMVRGGMGPVALVYASGLGMLVAALLQGARFLWITRRSRLQS